ncbi:type II toxin-antitoxin system VapC family toxin [Candidatus Fermentibacteria bacterium]|nr:type II toxin-antitoxin system VapC family toxin [Candidatus Fermentibacteria bacterium]
MIAYLDSSALVKLYVSESGSHDVRALIAAADRVAISVVAYPEARAALARRQREGAFSSQGLRRAVSALDSDLPGFVGVTLSETSARRAGDLAERRALRGADAIHIASAIELGHLLGIMPIFMSFDDRQARAAEAEGLRIVPPRPKPED